MIDIAGSAARLVRFDFRLRRMCNAAYAGNTEAHTAFADAYPLLVLSLASLADLNQRLETPLPQLRPRRFPQTPQRLPVR